MIEIFQECYRDTRVKGEYGRGDGRRVERREWEEEEEEEEEEGRR